MNIGVTANIVTVAGATICCLAGGLVALGGDLRVSGVLFLIGSACDALDGAVSRQSGAASGRGGVLDRLCDKLGECALLIGLLVRFQDPAMLRLVACMGITGLFASYSKAAFADAGVELVWSHTRVFGRTIRVLLLSAMLAAGAWQGAGGMFVIGSMLVGFNVLTSCMRWRMLREVA